MRAGQAYDNEEKVSRSEMVEQLLNAKQTVMTVNFRKKIDNDYVKNILSNTVADQFTDAKKLKNLSKELISGKSTEMTCHLVKCEGKLGRSAVIDLNAAPQNNYRQIDHRTIDSLVLKNTKYTVK